LAAGGWAAHNGTTASGNDVTALKKILVHSDIAECQPMFGMCSFMNCQRVAWQTIECRCLQ